MQPVIEARFFGEDAGHIRGRSSLRIAVCNRAKPGTVIDPDTLFQVDLSPLHRSGLVRRSAPLRW